MLTTWSVIKQVVLEPRVSPEHTSKYVDTVTVFAKTWTKGHWPLDGLWPHICWGLMCDSTQGSLCPSPMKIHQCMWIQWPFLPKLECEGHWPLDDLWPHICWGHMCDSTKGHCVQVPWKYIKVCGYSDPLCKNLNQRSVTPRWPLTPHLLRSYVWLYPRIIVSKSHENTSKYVDTVTFFAKKTWTKGHWPLDDLWPHICWGHMCDSTQGSLCPSPMKIHQSVWIQWTFLLKLEPKVIDP